MPPDPVNRETYSHEVVSFGFWAGDQRMADPAFYSYTAPERSGLRPALLRPGDTRWVELGVGLSE